LTTLTAQAPDEGKFHTKYFRSYEEVEYVFGLTFTPEQIELVQVYIFTGIRPDNAGCWTCTPGYIRKLTGKIDQYEIDLEAGRETWPWPLPDGQVVWELAHQV